MKVIFVGDRPSRLNTDPNIPFVGTPSYRNLCKWIEEMQIVDFLMVNSHGVNMSLYRFNRESMLTVDSSGDVYVALGNNASRALYGIPHFKLPHPSPKNRKLNDKEFIASELQKCYSYLKERECALSVET